MFDPIAFISWPGPFEMMLIAGIGLLFFGRRLPEVGRSLGRTIVEFKRGMREIEQEAFDIEPPRKLDQPRSEPAETSDRT